MELYTDFKYIFSSPRCPEYEKKILVAIPMYMYRVQTSDFSRGLNFFQLTILKFMVRTGISVDTIYEMLGIEPKITTIILGELMNKKLIDSQYRITAEGRRMLDQSDGFIIDDSSTKFGYVFQYVDIDGNYSYYIDHVTETSYRNRNGQIEINVNMELEKDNWYEPIYIFHPQERNQHIPSERQIVEIINDTTSLNLEDEGKYVSDIPHFDNFQVKVDDPIKVYLCTYIYMSRSEHDSRLFEPGWRVLDPFGMGDNVHLKFYLEKLNDTVFESILKERFGDVETTAKVLFKDIQAKEDAIVEDIIMSDFGVDVYNTDPNVQEYVRRVILSHQQIEWSNYSNSQASQTYITNLQQVFEGILSVDRADRPAIYERVTNNYFPITPDHNTVSDRINLLNRLNRRYVSRTERLSLPLFKIARKDKITPSLKYNILRFLLSLEYDSNVRIKNLICKSINDIVKYVDQLGRNTESHGHTSKEGKLKCISKNDADESFSFFKSFIHEYLITL